MDAPKQDHTITYPSKEAWAAEGVRRFGPDQARWAFVCPSCGHVATLRDWDVANAGYAAAVSCVGRYDGTGDDAKTFGLAGGPCTYAGFGLIGLNPVEIDGVEVRLFAFAEATLPGGAS